MEWIQRFSECFRGSVSAPEVWHHILRPSCAVQVERQGREYLQNDSNKILALFKVISVDWVDLSPDGCCDEASAGKGHEVLHAQKNIFLLGNL